MVQPEAIWLASYFCPFPNTSLAVHRALVASIPTAAWKTWVNPRTTRFKQNSNGRGQRLCRTNGFRELGHLYRPESARPKFGKGIELPGCAARIRAQLSLRIANGQR